MAAEKWECKELADAIKEEAVRNAEGKAIPKLLVISVGEDQASEVYVRNKEKDCTEIGFNFERAVFDETATTEDVISAIENSDATGIICQLPVPEHIDVDMIIDAIPNEKDVDCFKPENLGNIVIGRPGFQPCTPAGIMEILKAYNVDISGKKVLVIGRSNIVGKPLALMLINAGATVTVCNSKSNLINETVEADIIISAVGKSNLIQRPMINNPIIIDVGINRDVDGDLCGDVSKECYEKAQAITPVPGGVGLMTRAILMRNLSMTV